VSVRESIAAIEETRPLTPSEACWFNQLEMAEAQSTYELEEMRRRNLRPHENPRPPASPAEQELL
jgi:hypothetical protein